MSDRRRKRHGRVRRWVVRPLFWSLALAALVLLALYLALNSRWLRERAADLVEERVARLLDRPVSVAALRFELVPLTVELEGLVIGGRQPDEAPLAVVPHAAVDALLFWRDGLRLELRSVRLDEPVLNLIFDQGGGSNLPRRTRGTPAGPRRVPLQFALEELTVNRGELVIDHLRLPLDLSAVAVTGALWGEDEPQWRAAAQEIEITLPRAQPYRATMAVRGRLDDRAIEILNGRVAGPGFKAAAQGRLVFGPDRHGGIEIAAETGAGLLQRLGYVDDQLAGEFDFGGRVFWRLSEWGVQGAIAASSLRALNYPLRRLEGVINGDRDRFELEIRGADYAGGRVVGEVGIDLERGKKPEVALDLELGAVDLEQLMADQGWPVGGLGASVSGPFSYRFAWGQADRGTGWANLAVEPGEGLRLPFRGSVPLVIENGVVRVTAARLVSSRQRLQSSGSYDLDRKRGQFRFRVLSDAVEELLPLFEIEALQEESLWRPTAGRGRLEGTFRLAPSGPGLVLRMDLTEVEMPGASADELHGSLEIGRAGINRMRLELLRPEAGLIVTGGIPFAAPAEDSGASADGSRPPPFALTVDAAGWPLEEARVWLPFELPVSGPAYGSLRLGGSPEAINGKAAVEVRAARLFELPADTVSADLEFDAERVDFHELRLAVPAGSVTAAGSWSPASDELALDFTSEALDLGREPFSDWWAGALGGRLELAGSAAGTLARPRLAGRLSATELALDGQPLGHRGDASLDLDWDRGVLTANGSLIGLVGVDGGGRLEGPDLDLDLTVAAPDLAALARLFGLFPDLDLGGAGTGRLTVAGRLGGAEPLRTALELEQLTLFYEELQLSALTPVRLAWTPDSLVVESLYLGAEATGDDLFVIGKIGLGETPSLDLRLQASVDTAFAAALLPAFELRGGRLDLLGTVGGSLAAPRINGQGEVREARLVLGELPAFEGLGGALLFYPDQVVLDSVRGRFGGGDLRIGGTVGLPAPGKELTYRIQVSGQAVTLRYPEGWELRGDAELTVASMDGGRQLRGGVVLDRALYLQRVQVGLTQLLQTVFERRRQEVETTDEELASTQLNLVIDGPGALRVRNNVANLRGDLDLALRGSLARPVLFGRVELEPGGTLQVGGSDYSVERGALTFANPYRMEPIIDLTATTRRRDYDLSLNLSGTPERLEATMTSDPPLADLDVLGLLATGKPTRAGTPAVGAEAFLYGQAASAVAERVNRLFDLDRFRVDPLTGEGGSLSSARVTVGKQLSRDVLATYSYDPAETEQQILQLEWSVSRGLVLVVTQNGDGTYAVDTRWEKRF